MKSRISCLSGVMLCLLLNSCVSHKELLNFSDPSLPKIGRAEITNYINLTIQSEDLLRINVHSSDMKAAIPFNLEVPGQGNNMGQANQSSEGSNYPIELFMGYLVDQDGFIDFPVLGKIQLANLTIEEAKQKIISLLDPYINTPVVNMRFLNFKITVLGEVNLPGVKRLSNKRITLLEALGVAGDLTPYANRSNILIIREENGQRNHSRLDLQSSEIFSSPFFYLQQNDVIYVEPIKARIATVADPVQRFISYGSGIISIVTLVIALTR